MPLRDIDSYPPQEPFSEIGAKYNVAVQKLSAGVDGECFAYGDDPYQEVAVFTADNPTGSVLAFMHGGGWVNGYKEWPAFMAPALNDAGITFVSIGYRLAPQRRPPCGGSMTISPSMAATRHACSSAAIPPAATTRPGWRCAPTGRRKPACRPTLSVVPCQYPGSTISPPATAWRCGPGFSIATGPTTRTPARFLPSPTHRQRCCRGATTIFPI
jgi:hypothetical protein